MSCIKTYTGIMFDPLMPQEDLICITDIAHALSMLCRVNGHCVRVLSGEISISDLVQKILLRPAKAV